MRAKKKLIVFLTITLAAALLVIYGARRNYVIPILMYHSVYPNPDPHYRLAVSAESFDRQMRFLKEHRYNVVSLAEIARLLKNKRRIPPQTVAITLDDGYQNNYTYAFPVLRRYALPATIFIIVNEVGRRQGDRLSWEQIRQMQESGLITIGSHCLGPEPLVNLASEKEIKKEIFESKRILEETLGRKVEAFSYPEGRFTKRIRQLVIEAGYKVAVVTNPGKKFPNDDIFALKRLRIFSSSDNLLVFAVEASGWYNFIREHRHK